MHTSNELLQSKLTVFIIWLMLATSSIVIIEPAIYDVLGLGIILVLVVLGIRLPVGIGLPLALLTLYIIGNIIAAAINAPVVSFRSLFIRIIMVLNWILFASLIYQMPVRYLKVIWSGYITAACIAVLVGICAFLNLSPIFSFAIQYDRINATFKDPNVFGPFLYPPILYLISQIEKQSLLKAGLMVIVVLFFTLGIYLSFSRGAWVGTSVSLLLYGAIRFHTENTKKGRMRILSLFVAVCVLGALVPILSKFSENAESTFSNRFSSVSQSYDSSRFGTQRIAIAVAPTKPFGIGPDQSSTVLPFGLEPHNIYLHVLLEAGWMGAIAFYWFLILTMSLGFISCQRKLVTQNDAIIVFSSLSGILVQSLFIDSTHWRHLFLLLGMMWGLILYTRSVRSL